MNRAFRSVLAAVVLMACPAAFAQSDPWELPRGTDRKSLERKHSIYWDENYQVAVDILRGRRGTDPAMLNEAIERLRLAVAVEPRSSARARTPRGDVVEYVPYITLALAFRQLGQFEEAQKCLDREDRNELTKLRSGSQQWDELQQDLASRKANQAYVNIVAVVDNWRQGTGLSLLTDAGKSGAAGLAADRDSLRAAQTNDERQQLQQKIAQGLKAMIQAELVPRVEKLRELVSRDWSAAFVGQPLAADPAVCDASQAAATVQGMSDAQQHLERCAEAVDGALRQAGRLGCDHLTDLRERIADNMAAERDLGGSGESQRAPGIPAVCTTADWGQLPTGELWGAVEGLAFPAQRDDFVSTLDAINGRLAGARGEIVDSFRASLSRIPTVSSRCARELRVTAPASELGDLKRRLEAALADSNLVPGAELRGAPSRVDQELGKLVDRTRARVRQMIDGQGECQGVDPSLFEPLAGLEEAFRRTEGGGSRELDGLCTAVSTASRAVNECWGRNTASVQERLTNYRWFLEVADGSGPSAGSAPDGSSPQAGTETTPGEWPICVEQGLADLRGQTNQPGSNAGAWSSGVLAAVDAAQSCLGEYHEAHLGWVHGVRDRTLRTVETLQSVDGKLWGQQASRIDEMKRSLTAMQQKLGAIDELLFAGDAAVEPGELRRRTDASGLGANIEGRRWELVEGLSGEQQQEAVLAIRDEAIQPVVAEAEGALSRWAPIADRLMPVQELIQAYAVFKSGDLDAAIHTLRGAQSAGAFPERGRARALGHATLSYFLYLKGQAVSGARGGDESTRLLLDDASREAALALRADAGFRLPIAVFASAGFRNFFGAVTPQ